MQAVLGLIAGLGLSAACGFRVFVPMLLVSIGIHADAIHVAPEFAWIGSTPAMIALGAATVLEIAGYYVPGVDHFLDLVATPSAVVAGALLSTAFITDIDPWLRWSLAMIVGGGVAGVVQVATVAARTVSGVTTFGLGNPLVATGELAGSTGVSIAAMVAPILALVLVVLVVAFLAWRWSKRRERAVTSAPAPA
ncbi:MAG: DUF4126 domain-containing protein [Planctomycetes bacterium]|nr:DUF4126 domain-containing protein [Planctomycetota bacterium]